MIATDTYTFDEWWADYDYKLDRKRCERLFLKIPRDKLETVRSHTQRYVASTFVDGRFPSRRHPGTYLQNENYHDEALIRSGVKRIDIDTPTKAEYINGLATTVHDRLARRRDRAGGATGDEVQPQHSTSDRGADNP